MGQQQLNPSNLYFLFPGCKMVYNFDERWEDERGISGTTVFRKTIK